MCAIFRLSIARARCNPIVYLLSTLSLDLYTSRYDLISFGWVRMGLLCGTAVETLSNGNRVSCACAGRITFE